MGARKWLHRPWNPSSSMSPIAAMHSPKCALKALSPLKTAFSSITPCETTTGSTSVDINSRKEAEQQRQQLCLLWFLFLLFAYLIHFIVIYVFGFRISGFHTLDLILLYLSLGSLVPVALRNLPEKCHIWGKVQFDVTTALAYFIQKIQQPETVKPLTNKTSTDTRTQSHNLIAGSRQETAQSVQMNPAAREGAGGRAPRSCQPVTHVAFAEVHGHLAFIPQLAVHGSPHQQVWQAILVQINCTQWGAKVRAHLEPSQGTESQVRTQQRFR